MKQEIKKAIQQVLTDKYPEHKDIEFSVDFAPDNVEADFASNAAMVLAKQAGETGLAVAEAIAGQFADASYKVSVAKPGFLNFTMPQEHWHKVLAEILNKGAGFGRADAGRGQKVNIESVSANPTGPLTVGHGRGAVLGQVLANVLESQGYEVSKDYYYNDAGMQMKKLGESLMVRIKQELGEKTELPEELYQGEYIRDLAKAYINEKKLTEAHGDLDEYAEFASEKLFQEIRQTLDKLGIGFDHFVKETSFSPEETLNKLDEAGITYKKEGAVWLKNQKDKEDRVLMRSTGEPTYRLPDIAYHLEKMNKYDRVVDILGADHISQFPDVAYAVSKLGGNVSKLVVIINQFVTLKSGKKMSTRAASYVTLDELIDEAGVSVTKFFFAQVSANTHMTFDLDLARDTSEKNPVYKIQYAHARINSILEKAQTKPGNLEKLTEAAELELIKELGKYRELLNEVSENYNVHQLPHYLLSLADSLHSFYEKIKVITDDKQLTEARVGLVKGVQTVLANGLRIIGIEPLEKM